MARAHHVHFVKETIDQGFWGEDTSRPKLERVFYCGETDLHRFDKTSLEPRDVSCPNCSKKLGKEMVKALDIDLKVVPWPTGGRAWRSANHAMLNGEPFAHILMDEGWGKGYQIRALAVDLKDESILVGAKPAFISEPHTYVRDGVEKVGTRTVLMASAHSKEMALYIAYQFLLRDALKPLTKVKEEAAGEIARQAESRARWQRIEAEDAQKKKDMLEALEAIRTRGETGPVTMSNFEVASLADAIAILTKAQY